MKPSKKMTFIIFAILALFSLLAAFGIGDAVKGVREMRYGIDIKGGVEAVFEPDGIDRKATATELETARNIIESRLDNLSITDREVTIDKTGGYIIVRFPWKSDEKSFDPETAIQELGEMAKLTFRDPEGNTIVEGKNVKSATVTKNNSQSEVSTDYVVALKFDSKGAKLFEAGTQKLIGQQMGIYMDEDQISNPTVNEKISGGEAIISNIGSYSEAKKLADKINAGALPFSLKTTNFSTISPTLGKNALNIMLYAGMIAFGLICIFMLAYYRFTGFVACVTLTLQTVLQLLSVSIPQFSLTLPGIAGIILSVGMAVDANIIISERITDELGKGKSLSNAIKSGYKNAFSAVFDGNMTTAIVAVILMKFGSGAMLSFGYTLMIGMVINLVVGVAVSRILLQSFMEFKPLYKEKFFRTPKERKTYRFYEKKVLYLLISGSIFITGIAFGMTKGLKLDTQFTGGVVLRYATEEKLNASKIEDALEKLTKRPVNVQFTVESATKAGSVSVTIADKKGMTPEQQKEITKEILKVCGKGSVELSETYVVEPYIGKKAMNNAIIAIILSLIFIIIYVWVRFSGLAAGVTATIALVHDVLVVLVAFTVFGIPLNDAFVAVVLTIIGFSINDTIVLYDRVRELSRDDRSLKEVDLINKSVSEIFQRSINTSITTTISIFVMMLAAVLFGINSIREFALPMFFGLISGAYSTICIAGTLWAMWKKRKETKKAATA